MLDQLMQLIQQGSQQAVSENPAIPNEHNEAIQQEAQRSITNSLQGLANTGDLQRLTESVQQGNMPSPDDPVVQRISGDFSGNIMQKLGLNSGMAKMIAAAVIPMVLGKIMKGSGAPGANQQQGGFDLGGLLSSITGGNAGTASTSGSGGGLMDQISSIGAQLGLDKDGDGDVDLNDLTQLFKK